MRAFSRKAKAKVWPVAPYLLTFGILYVLLKHIGIHVISDQLSGADPVYIIYALLLNFVFVILAAFKLKMLLRIVGCDIAATRSLKITLGTHPLNVILPSKGGDFIKSWALRDIMPFSQSIGIVILERLIDLTLLCLMSFVGSFWLEEMNLILLSFSIFVLGLSAILALKIINVANSENQILKHLKEVGYAASCLLANGRYFKLIVAISCVIWLGSTFQMYLLFLAVGQKVPFIFCIVMVPVVIFIGLIPVTVSGMGTRDVAIVYLFSPFASSATSVSVGLLFSLLRYWIPALIGLPFVKNLKGASGIVSAEKLKNGESIQNNVGTKRTKKLKQKRDLKQKCSAERAVKPELQFGLQLRRAADSGKLRVVCSKRFKCTRRRRSERRKKTSSIAFKLIPCQSFQIRQRSFTHGGAGSCLLFELPVLLILCALGFSVRKRMKIFCFGTRSSSLREQLAFIYEVNKCCLMRY